MKNSSSNDQLPLGDLLPKKHVLFEILFTKNEVLLLSLCSKYYPASPYDGLQNFALKLLEMEVEKLKEIKSKGTGYLVVILKNSLIDLNRKNKNRQKKHELNPYQKNDHLKPVAEKNLAEEEHLSTARERLQKESHYQVFKLGYEGNRNKDIAEELGMNEKTVATIKRRNRKKLSDLV